MAWQTIPYMVMSFFLTENSSACLENIAYVE